MAQLYLFDEENIEGGFDGDIEDEDPWVPDPGDCTTPQWDPSCMCFVQCRTYKENAIKEATRFLKANGINPQDLYNEAMLISGNEEEIIDENATAITAGKYHPAGKISVRDNDANINVPLKGVTIKSRRWFNLSNTFTDVNGNFRINRGYRKKATVLVKFKSGAAKIKGINGLLKEWQYVFPTKKNIGLYTKSDMENINYLFNYNANASTNEAMHWVAAHAANSVWDMYRECQVNGLAIPPANLNIWVSSAVTVDASTPMLRRIANPSNVSGAIDIFLASSPVGWPVLSLKRIIQSNLPDITLRYGVNNGANTRRSADINNTFFHELAHSLHYQQVGNSYWGSVIDYILHNRGYGNRTEPDYERIAISEAWGFFIGNTFNEIKYNTTNTATIAVRMRDQLEFQTPDDNVAFQFSSNSSRGWIPFGMLHDMRDNGEPTGTGVIDNVNIYTIPQIFRGYQPTVATVQGYRQEVVASNGNLQATEMGQLVTSYRY